MHSSQEGGAAPLFVLATRMYVRYKFKMRRNFDPQRVLADDAYAREVVTLVRNTRDSQLLAMADRFELARFGSLAPAVRQAEPARSEPYLDLPLENPG